jgi:hypothetical protein
MSAPRGLRQPWKNARLLADDAPPTKVTSAEEGTAVVPDSAKEEELLVRPWYWLCMLLAFSLVLCGIMLPRSFENPEGAITALHVGLAALVLWLIYKVMMVFLGGLYERRSRNGPVSNEEPAPHHGPHGSLPNLRRRIR